MTRGAYTPTNERLYSPPRLGMKRERGFPAIDGHIWRKQKRLLSPDYSLDDYLKLLIRQGLGPDSSHPVNAHLFDVQLINQARLADKE